MLKLAFYPPQPTSHTFRSAADASSFAAQQATLWRDFIAPRRVHSQDGFPASWLVDRWNEFAGQSSGSRYEDRSNWPELQHQADQIELVTFNSEFGISLRQIADKFGNQVFDGAIRCAYFKSYNSQSKYLDVSQLFGLSLIADMLSPDSRKPTAAAAQAFREKIEEFSQLSNIQLESSNRLETECENLLNKVKNKWESQEVDYEDWRARANDQITEQMQNWSDEWVNIKKAFEEELRLKAPITFWTTRAKTHRISARSRGRQLIGWGALGALITVAVAAALFNRLLFDSGFQSIATPLERGAIAGTGSLFFATIYLWAMRLLTRFFVSEHHLAVDAHARAAMAYTYLSLIKKGAVDEKDRAIVLESLFRPVSDGMVRDDAMPNFTPAAILSAGAVRGQ